MKYIIANVSIIYCYEPIVVINVLDKD